MLVFRVYGYLTLEIKETLSCAGIYPRETRGLSSRARCATRIP